MNMKFFVSRKEHKESGIKSMRSVKSIGLILVLSKLMVLISYIIKLTF